MSYLFILTTFVHIFIFLLSLFLIYIFMIEKDIKKIILKIIKKNIRTELLKLKQENIINKGNIDYYKTLVSNTVVYPSNNCNTYIELLVIMILLILFIFTVIILYYTYKYISFYYFLDLFIVAMSIGAVEILFFTYFSSKYFIY